MKSPYWIGTIIIILIASGIALYPSDYRGMLSDNPNATYVLLENDDALNILTRGYDDYIRWKFDNDENTIYLGRNKGAVEKWYVEYERYWLTKSTVVNLSICVSTTPTRCYVDNYWERLWRKASLIDLTYINDSNSVTVLKSTPYYGYGKRVGSGGTLLQEMLISDDASYINFPVEYKVSFTPSDGRTYSTNKLIWHVEKLPLNDDYGVINDCLFEFSNNVKIDICPEIDMLDYYEVNMDKGSIDFYFKPKIGEQLLDLRLYDPPGMNFTVSYPTNVTKFNVTADSWYGWFTPQGQNKTVGVFNISNNGDANFNLTMKLNETISDLTVCVDNDAGRRGCMNLTNSSEQHVHTNLSVNASQFIWAWVFLDYPESINVTHALNISFNTTEV